MANSKIRQSARGKDCTVRIPGVCNGNHETVVLCHVGRKRGMGIKCNDIHAIYACSACHAFIDGPDRFLFETRSMVLDALEETQLIMIDEGLIKI